MGSIPVRVTKRDKSELFRKSKLVRICFLLQLFELRLNITAESDQMVTLGGFVHFTKILSFMKSTVFFKIHHAAKHMIFTKHKIV